MFTDHFSFKGFNKKKKSRKIQKSLRELIHSNDEVIRSLTNDYDYSYTKKFLKELKRFKFIRVFGMGGSSLGAHAIYDFLRNKVRNDFYFISNLKSKKFFSKKKYLNLIISKSGNTLETIANANAYTNKYDKNILITENKKSILKDISYKVKDEIINHNNFIGGRYSVLSEVGMLPAELMGLNEKKFKKYNYLIKNKKFINQLVLNVSSIIRLIKEKKLNSIILNYDERSNNFFQWYQQLVAESLGKKSKGILPIISTMPKDNHGLMQLYLDGPKNNFYTFFNVKEKRSEKINNYSLLKPYQFLKNKSLYKLINAQMEATRIVFEKKKLPFRSFEILNRSEDSMGELFCFFILETILLGRALNINPFDQPSVELIKTETKRILF